MTMDNKSFLLLVFASLIIAAAAAAGVGLLSSKENPTTLTTPLENRTVSAQINETQSRMTSSTDGSLSTLESYPFRDNGSFGLITPRDMLELLSVLARLSSAWGQAYSLVMPMLGVPEALRVPGVIELTTTAAVAALVDEGGLSYTVTNVQVEGVDELDYVKTNGTHIFAISGKGELIIARIYPPGQARVIYSLSLQLDRGAHPGGLFILDEGRRLAIIVTVYPIVPLVARSQTPENPMPVPEFSPPAPYTQVSIYEITREGLQSVGVTNVTGWLAAARLYDGTLYIVTQQPLYRVQEDYLPLVNGRPLEVGSIRISPYPTWGFTTIVAVTPDGEVRASSIATPPVARIYMSPESLYIFSEEYKPFEPPLPMELILGRLPPDVKRIVETINASTTLAPGEKQAMIRMLIDRGLASMSEEDKRAFYKEYVAYLEESAPQYIGPHTTVYKIRVKDLAPMDTGLSLPGRLLDQFAIHETSKGLLVVATTANELTYLSTQSLEDYLKSPWGIPRAYPRSTTVNNVYVVSEGLEVLSSLEGLAPGERVYSARYIGDYLFLVTFRQVDPLFAINLSDPIHPRVVSELKVPGFSEYLHPVGKGMLLGIGVHADESGRARGLKISLFNVTDPLQPRVVDELVLEINNTVRFVASPVLYDHKAFTYLPLEQVALVPVTMHMQSPKTIILYLNVSSGSIKVLAELEHGGANRAFIVEDSITTVSPQKAIVWNRLNGELIAEVGFS